MARLAITVVIPTYNRATVVGRAIESALAQGFPDVEVIVVDDASQDTTAEVVQRLYPQVRYLRQGVNQGPGAARNRGIREASNPWVVMLDDDDTLVTGALDSIAAHVGEFPEADGIPVFQFACGNGSIPNRFMVVSLDDYLHGVIQGDFVPLIQARRFLELGLAYPASKVGAEHSLWWRIALDYGIPTWNTVLSTVHTDASNRLTSMEQQLNHARQHAEAQELTLKQFGSRMKERAPTLYAKKRLGAATYWLLCGERASALDHLREPFDGPNAAIAVALRALSFMPVALTRRLLVLYRRFAL